MPRRSRQSQSNDHDLVPYTKYRPKARLPPEYDKIKVIPSFKPMELEPITNPAPNLPTDLDLDDPIALFRLFFTNEIIQSLVDCTNHQAERERERTSVEPCHTS
jgi:hypothetical protein